MLDDSNIIAQRDPSGALKVAVEQYLQTQFEPLVENGVHDGRQIDNIVIAGMGGSALAALLLKSWQKNNLKVPFEVVRTYDLPGYVGKNTLVIVSSYSGNTEETVSCLGQARERGAQLCAIASGGELIDVAKQDDITFVQLPANLQPRMAVIYNLVALDSLLSWFELVGASLASEIKSASEWLRQETAAWGKDVPTDKNYAKQLALLAVGKTAVFYGGSLVAPVAYKWKISWNENAKNLAFWNEIPEFSHNEFIGWTSHPVEKPFAVFDIVSDFEHPQILKRFKVSDKLLSGRRPQSTVVNLKGDSVVKQMLWGSILADFVSIYLAILNGVDPTPVALIEKMKKELA